MNKQPTPPQRMEADPAKGLTQAQVSERMAIGWVNRAVKSTEKTYAHIFFKNIFTFFNLLCTVVALALIFVGAPLADLFFLVIIITNTAIAIYQEIKAKRTLAKLSLLSAPMATVMRDGQQKDISVHDVVLDDVLCFFAGNQICTDALVAEGAAEVNESLLTGESLPVRKQKGDFLYGGSFIASGHCTARVCHVGKDNYMETLSQKAKKFRQPHSELMAAMNLLIKSIGFLLIPIGILLILNNYREFGGDTLQTVTKSAGAIIGMIPAGMFLLTSVALAVGILRLSRRQTLVQDLFCIEMLARVDVLCLDKTGTLTDGRMKVCDTVMLGGENEEDLKTLMGSLLSALHDNNQTAVALKDYFPLNAAYLAENVLPFSSSRKLSAASFKGKGTYVLGAPEFVLKKRPETLDALVNQYALSGLRVLLLASSPEMMKGEVLPQDLSPIALILLQDHIREDAPRTLQWFKESGVAIKVISGDNPCTVSEVARRVGVQNAESYISLEGMGESEVRAVAEAYTVFGRVTPEQKCTLVQELKAKGHTVAMTGDGVNDILALKEADCSVAMAAGSEATRQVAQLVLLDSNFASMPQVVEEGRRVVNNIQKSSSMFLMKTFFTILLSIATLCFTVSYPFSPSQMMLVEVFAIGVPSFFLALQPNKKIITGRFLSNVIKQAFPGALTLLVNIAVLFILKETIGDGQFSAMAVLCTTFSALVVLSQVCRPYNIYRAGLMLSMTAATIGAIIVTPQMFGLVPLTTFNVLLAVVLVQSAYWVVNILINLADRIKDRRDALQ